MILLGLLSLSLASVGGYMLYSAITGRGVAPPDENASVFTHAQYKVRGIIGLAFFIFGMMMLWGFFKMILN